MSERIVNDFLGFPPGSTAIVTGAASGIGRATSEVLLSAGLRVVGADIDEVSLSLVGSDLGERFVARRLDVSDAVAVKEMMTELRAEFGPISHLVNNAGPPSSEAFSIDEGLARTAGSMQTVTATWATTGPPVGASVVNVASVAGVVSGGPPPSLGVRSRGSATTGWYAIGKAAIGGLTRYQAVSFDGRIRANGVAPGVIETPRLADIVDGPYGRLLKERTPVGRLGQPVDVARAITFLLSPAASYVNGVTLVIDGGGTLVF